MRNANDHYSMVPAVFLTLAAVRSALRVAQWAPEARRAAMAVAAGFIVLAGAIPALPIDARLEEPRPPRAVAAAAARAIPARVPVYAPVHLYPALSRREDFGCWWSTGPLGREPDFRARYAYIVLWPAGDPPNVLRDAPLADSLAHDERFVALDGFEPYLVFKRR